MVAMLVTVIGFANESSFFSIKNDAKRTALTLNYVKEGNLLSIKDDNGVILYKETIQINGVYQKGFDLTSLPDGSYMFELDKDVEISIIPFTVLSGEVDFNKKEEKVFFKPITRVVDDLVYVSKLQLDKSPFKIEIYYMNNGKPELIHTETIKNEKVIGKMFKLRGLTSEKYKMVYHTENRIFEKTIIN